MRKWIAGAGLLAAGLIAGAPAASAVATSQTFYGSSAGFGSEQAIRYATDSAWRKVASGGYTRDQCYVSSSQARPTGNGWYQADVAVFCVKP
ncbi:hypothetical protein [Amycolatopsis sp. NPDC059657]|uniref:hypothetical protein n=1 Tax=Amycolatopsis sp. NPDC059657 TaxID=3346899 RepID=UPI00366AB6DA